MDVSYKWKVVSDAGIENKTARFDLDSVNYELSTDDLTGLIDSLKMTFSNVPQTFWPQIKIVPSNLHGSSPSLTIEHEKELISETELRAKLLRFEGFISPTAVLQICWEDREVKWLPNKNDNIEGAMLSAQSKSKTFSANPISFNSDELRLAMVIANQNFPELIDLGHFTQANLSFTTGRYLDAIRHSFFLLEAHFAPGKFNNKLISDAMSSSTDFVKIVDGFKIDQPKIYSKILKDAEAFTNLKSKKQIQKSQIQLIADHICENIRGRIQHSQSKPSMKWQSSTQFEWRIEAIFMLSIAQEVCYLVRKIVCKQHKLN